MKKLFTILLAILALSLALSSLVACDVDRPQEESQPNGGEVTEETSNSSPDEPATEDTVLEDTLPEEGDTPNEELASINMSTLVRAQPFSDDLAFVSTVQTIRPNICINTKGQILFTLPEDVYARAGYANGIAPLSNDTFIDKTGKVVISPELQGYDYCLTYSSTIINDDSPSWAAFSDGYIPVCKVNESFSGTTYQYGVLAPDGTWLVELSDSYLPNQKYVCPIEYVNGYIQIRAAFTPAYDIWWNLKDGSVPTETPAIYEYEFFNTSYGWKNEAGESMLENIYEKFPTIHGGGDFVLGEKYTYIRFSNNSIRYISLIDREGNLLFDPLPAKYAEQPLQDAYAKRIYIFTAENKIVIYDLQGNKLIESAVPTSGGSVLNVRYDDVGDTYLLVMVDERLHHSYHYIDSDGNLLF